MAQAVSDIIATQQTAITTTITGALDYINKLNAATDVTFANAFNINTKLPDQYDYASVPNTNFVAITAGRTTSTGVVGASSPPAAPTLNPLQVIAVTIPQLLSSDLLAPTNTFQYYEGVYDRMLLDPLRAKLLYDLQNGGYGIEVTDELALFNRARDREVEAAMSRIETAARDMAARGFPVPPGELAVTIDRAYQDMQNKVSSVSRDITLERAKLYVDNRQFTIREVRELETVTVGLYNSIQERALNVAKLTVEMSIAIYNAQVNRFKLALEAAKISADVQVAELQAQVEEAKANMEIYRGQIMAYTADVQRQVESAKLQVDVYRADIENYKTLNDVTIARTTIQTKALEATVQQNIQISQMTIENAKAQLLAAVEGLRFRTEGAKFGASWYGTQLAALEGSVNTLATQSSTGP